MVELINPKAIFEKHINSRKLVTSFKEKKQGEKIQINKRGNENGEVTTKRTFKTYKNKF